MNTSRARAAATGLLVALLCLVLGAALLPPAPFAQAAHADDADDAEASVLASGSLDGIEWAIDADYTLTISPASEEVAQENGSEPGEMAWVSAAKIPWKSYQSSIAKVVVEDGVTSVYSLRGLTACSDFELADTVATIGSGAFYGCTGLTSLEFLPDSVVSIEDQAFYGTGITSLDGLPDSVASIGSCVFAYCKSLAHVRYPDALAASVTAIADVEFGTLAEGAVIDLSNMVNLESVGGKIAQGSVSPTIILPEGLESFPGDIGGNASDVRLVIPSTVGSIEGTYKLGGAGVGSTITSIELRFGALIEESLDAAALAAALGQSVQVVEAYDLGGVSTEGNLSECFDKTTVTMDFAGTADEAPTIYYLAAVDAEPIEVDAGLLAFDEDAGAWRLSIAGTSEGYATGLYAAVDAEAQAGFGFSDVQDASTYYFAAVYVLADAGCMTGMTDELFGVGQGLTREQMVTVLYRIFATDEEKAAYGSTVDAEAFAATSTSGLSDVQATRYYTAAVNWAFETGVATGYTDGSFGVGDGCTFEQFCTFLARGAGVDAVLTDAEAQALLSSFADGASVSAYADNSVAYLTSVTYDGVNAIVGGTTAHAIEPASLVARERAAAVLYRCMAAGLF